MSSAKNSFDFSKPADCRAYIEHFQTNVLKKKTEYVDTATRRIWLEYMTDEEAETVAHGFWQMEVTAKGFH